jgi:hypothetical protein
MLEAATHSGIDVSPAKYRLGVDISLSTPRMGALICGERRRRRLSSLFTHCRATSFHKHLREVTIAQAMSTRRKPALWRHGAYRPCSEQCCLHEVLQLRSP